MDSFHNSRQPYNPRLSAKGNNMNYALKNLITRRLLMVAWTTTLVVGFMVSLPQLAHAQDSISPPIVPAGLDVEAGNEVFLLGRGVGTQNYVCAPCDPTKPNCPLGVAFTLFTPQATLFNDQGEQLITHFSSPNPVGGGTVRVSWQDSRDTSAVWAKLINAVTVRTDSIPWVL